MREVTSDYLSQVKSGARQFGFYVNIYGNSATTPDTLWLGDIISIGNYSVTSSGQMDYTTGITGDVYCYSAIYQSEVAVSGLSDVLNGDFTAVVWFKKNPYSGYSRLIWFTFNDLYYGVEFQGSACRALGAGFTNGNYADVEWHSCAIVKSGSRFATVFDGKETLTCDIGVTSNSGDITLSWNSAEFFHGYIDSLRLYGRALTDEELKKALALK